jgi:hypothetical protein
LPFIPQRVMSMWRDLPFPPTFLTLLVGRRQDQADYSDAFVARLNSRLTQILQSTYLGGSDTMMPTPLPFIPQRAMSMWRDIPIPPTFLTLLAGRRQSNRGGGYYDAFVARLNSNLTQILQSTYLGGSSDDFATPLPFIPQRAMSMWRDGPDPPTFLTLLAGRRQAEVAAWTPLWQG